MVNKNILKVLEENKKGHIIFESQDPRDLDELKYILKKRGDLVVDIPEKEWFVVAPLVFEENPAFRIQATRKYIAARLLVELEKKYPQLKEYGGTRHLEAIQTGDVETFKNEYDLLYSLDDIRDMLEIEGIQLNRLHIIMNGNRSNILCDAASVLLRDDNPYSTSIYTAPNMFYTSIIPDAFEKTNMRDAYNFTIYQKFDEGIVNKAKKKQKKYEKV